MTCKHIHDLIVADVMWCPRCGRIRCKDGGELTPSLIQTDLSDQTDVYKSVPTDYQLPNEWLVPKIILIILVLAMLTFGIRELVSVIYTIIF
jgi:hypothetical protein